MRTRPALMSATETHLFEALCVNQKLRCGINRREKCGGGGPIQVKYAEGAENVPALATSALPCEATKSMRNACSGRRETGELCPV